MNKEEILQEIRRIAKAQGGKAPGERLFEREAGIRKSDWYGKFWARWGDAIREAGLSPNELVGPIDEESLLDKYARFAQELGHLPVSGELRLKARQESSFPSHNIWGKWGGKSELVKMLAQYCQSHPEYADVLQMCKDVPRARDVSKDTKTTTSGDGFVYLIKSGRFYKIGKTNALGRREYELAIQLPQKTNTVHSIRTDDPDGIEEYWHERFASKRKNGEWFELSAADVASFKRRKFM